KMQQIAGSSVETKSISQFGTLIDSVITGGYKQMTTETLNYPVWQSDAGTAKGKTKKEAVDVAKASDFDLAQAASKGDMVAFEEIYQRHHRRVYSICLRMLQNAHEAEDLTQDVFIQLYRKIGSFRGD